MKSINLVQEIEGAFNASKDILSEAKDNNKNLSDINNLNLNQHIGHGIAWYATYIEAISQLKNWIENLNNQSRLTPLEEGLAGIGAGEYCLQILHGIPMSQNETIRPHELKISSLTLENFRKISKPLVERSSSKEKNRVMKLLLDSKESGISPDDGLDETFQEIKNQFRRFVDEEISPNAHKWHLNDEYIPLDVIKKMADLGVFGLTIPEKYGGLGLEKKAMCIVSEELSRGWIGVGSLGTRSEIAAELILIGGTENQKKKYLKDIASGEIFPTAVFSEPDIGSDLAHLKTRGTIHGDQYLIQGNKTWITHGARADLMTLLVRTNNDLSDHKGLSMFLAEKPRENVNEFFPADGMSGGEINVIGYRGMKEFDIAFDGFEIPSENLLGGVEGKGFIHLMSTFESARIQTAARAIGVSQNACDVALSYATDRIQFSKKLIEFPRISEKLIMMFAETMIVRQLTFHAANIKDSNQRCDMEAGMAKLLGARVAWSSADNALQIHGGMGFAMETPISRILADARILSIFEGTAEIQAQVIARRLMENKNK
jgi:(2S)-methylsuccinyl-CoA dehydrogenase